MGKNSKRHDLERRTVPYLHDSDLQQGDVQAMEQGQRVAPKQTQQPATQQPPQQSAPPAQQTTSGVPDPIDFIASRSQGTVALPGDFEPAAGSKLSMWAPMIRSMVRGPGSSGMLAGALIDQMRQLAHTPTQRRTTIVDLDQLDEDIALLLEDN